MSGTHSLFAPSSAHRVIDCPASLRATRFKPDDAGFDAVHGTVAHYIHEKCLLDPHKSPHKYVGMHPIAFMPHDEMTEAEWRLLPYTRGMKPGDFFVTREDANAIEESILRCRELPGDHYVEQRVDISPWCPKVYLLDEDKRPIIDPKTGKKIIVPQRGTADFFACSPGVLNIRDYKHGTGVQVFAERNYQGILYALGVINEYDWEYDFDKVVIGIHQPRLHHFDEWETSKEELLEIGKFIKERFTLAMSDDAPFGPTEKACKFCRINSDCQALTDEVLGMFDFEGDADPIDVKLEADLLPLERKVEIYKRRGLFKLWMGGIEADLIKKMTHDPRGVPGLKLVAGRSSRYFPNEKEAIDELALYVDEDSLYTPRTLKSPAQIEKLLPRKERSIVSELAKKRPGKPTIVDADDPRPEWDGGSAALAESEFDDESED